MANLRYLRCAKCGSPALPRKAIIKDGKIIQAYETGTSTLMRCSDCCENSGIRTTIPENEKISKNISIKPKRQKRSDTKKEFAVYLNEVYLISFDSILACQIFAENLTKAISA